MPAKKTIQKTVEVDPHAEYLKMILAKEKKKVIDDMKRYLEEQGVDVIDTEIEKKLDQPIKNVKKQLNDKPKRVLSDKQKANLEKGRQARMAKLTKK